MDILSFRFWAAGLGALLLLAGCGDEDDGGSGKVQVQFIHSIDGAALDLDDTVYTNAAGNQYKVSRLEYIISQVVLEQEGGRSYSLADQHYIDGASTSTHKLLAERVPAGTYSRLSFRFGVTGNGPGSLPNSEDFNNMAWPEAMGGGYHYMKFEGSFQNGASSDSFALHTGPSGGGDYSLAISLPIVLEVDGDGWRIEVNMDLNQWLVGPQVYDFADAGPIMGNGDAQALLQANGVSVFTAGAVRQVELSKLVDDRDDGEHEHDGDDEGAHQDGEDDHEHGG